MHFYDFNEGSTESEEVVEASVLWHLEGSDETTLTSSKDNGEKDSKESIA